MEPKQIFLINGALYYLDCGRYYPFSIRTRAGSGRGKQGPPGPPGPSGHICFEEGTGFEACQQINTEGPNNASGAHSLAIGSGTIASGDHSFSSGAITIAAGIGSHTEGVGTQANGLASHAEGFGNFANGDFSHAEGGLGSIANGFGSHAEGVATQANGSSSHSEGNGTQANGDQSHAEGKESIATGSSSHAEGGGTESIGDTSHSEGNITKAFGRGSHAEGEDSWAVGAASQAGGHASIAHYHSSIARASGIFRDRGDAQFEIGTERFETTDDTPSELFIDGNTGTMRLDIPSDSSWKFVVDLVAVDINTGDTLSRQFQGVIKNVAGVTSILANIFPVASFETQIAQDAALGVPFVLGSASAIIDPVASAANDALVITVQGQVGKIIDWMSKILMVQIKY